MPSCTPGAHATFGAPRREDGQEAKHMFALTNGNPVCGIGGMGEEGVKVGHRPLWNGCVGLFTRPPYELIMLYVLSYTRTPYRQNSQ